jgi:polyisoprenoid-binding protein YceI
MLAVGAVIGPLVVGPARSAGQHAASLSAQAGPGAVRYAVVAEQSEARYRVREQLVGLNFPNDAVGSTRAIEGGVAFDAEGRVLATASRLTINLGTLRSDETRRDNYIRRNTLETDRYPTAVFVPAEIRGLPVPLPPSGSASLQVMGDLTVRDVTRRVTWEATAAFDGAEVSVRARTSFRFEDFGLRVPRVSVVLSVEDAIRLEADLRLRRAAG